MAAVVLVAAAALVLLRTGVGDPPPRSAAPTGLAPTGSAPPGPVPREPAPPYDRRPGRTPIPEPVRTGSQLSGPLPAMGGPSRTAAARAVGLVLGRFCLDPAEYTYTMDPDPAGSGVAWRGVRVLVFGLRSSGAGPVVQLSLIWTGRAYRWVSSPALLRGC